MQGQIFIKILILNLFIISANAEYRVYEYLTVSKGSLSSTSSGKIIQTHLPPQAYLAYYGSRQVQSVELLRTWMCPGYTGQLLPPCLHPLDQWKIDQVLQLNKAKGSVQ